MGAVTLEDGFGSGLHEVGRGKQRRQVGVIWAVVWDPRAGTRELRGYAKCALPACEVYSGRWRIDDEARFDFSYAGSATLILATSQNDESARP